MAAPNGPALPTNPDKYPVNPPPAISQAGVTFKFRMPQYFSDTKNSIASPMPRVINSFGNSANETAPKMLKGMAPDKNNATGFHCICEKPKATLDKLPIN